MRSVASSRGALRDGDREGVEDHEGADKHGDAAEGQQHLLDDRDLLVRVARLGLHLGRAGDNLGAGGHDRLQLLDERFLGDAVRGGHQDLVELTGLVEHVLRSGEVEDGQRDLTGRPKADELCNAGDRELSHGAPRGDANRVAHVEAMLLGRPAVDRNLRRP